MKRRSNSRASLGTILGTIAGVCFGIALIAVKLLSVTTQLLALFVSYGPILAAEFVCVLFQGWDWTSAVVIPVAAALSYYIAIAAINARRMRNTGSKGDTVALATYLSKFCRGNFEVVSKDRLARAVLGERRAREIFPEFFEHSVRHAASIDMLMRSQRLHVIRVADIERDSGEYPYEMVTFMTWASAWIFIQTRPDRLTGLEYFKVLHELGHVKISSLVREDALSPWAFQVFLFSIPVFLLRANQPLLLVVVLALVGVLSALATYLAQRRETEIRLLGEIDADCFALRHSQAGWFGQHPAEDVAKKLCRDKRLPEEENRKRRAIFVKNLGRLREGKTNAIAPLAPENGRLVLVERVLEYLIVSFLASIGLFYADVQKWQLDSMLGAVGIAWLLAVFYSRWPAAVELLVGLRIRGFDEPPPAMVEGLRGVRRWLVRLNRKRAPRMHAVYSLVAYGLALVDRRKREMQGLELAVTPSAPCTTDRLFGPEEAKLVVKDTLPPQPYIVYEDRDLESKIRRLEYHCLEHWVRVRNDGEGMLDLGLQIDSRFHPFLEDAAMVGLVKMKGEKILDQTAIPLVKVRTWGGR